MLVRKGPISPWLAPRQSTDSVPETEAIGDSVPLSHMRSDPVEDEMFAGKEVGEGSIMCGDKRPRPSIVKRVRTLPRVPQPLCNAILSKRSRTHVGVSSEKLLGTDSNVGGAPPEKVQVRTPYVCLYQEGDESQQSWSAGASVYADVRAVAREGSLTGPFSVVHFVAVGEEAANEDALPSRASKEAGNPTTIITLVITTAEDSAPIPSEATFSISSPPTESSAVDQAMSQVLKIFLEN
ncbi:LOW QUALITY PROTEIN: hypothetical protein Cgig2_025582 [Carnegiea gigantea]|uniref:Uncharacterized protein n=1 Tax=Carnegiea gigantea TaxID=171969 RepID=A0A9Q1JYH3_9CARY|nr:LOW QUALITY PROTEIN: hypothetical protein Cgig2_025582 [Carnegiea gigantea]